MPITVELSVQLQGVFPCERTSELLLLVYIRSRDYSRKSNMSTAILQSWKYLIRQRRKKYSKARDNGTSTGLVRAVRQG